MSTSSNKVQYSYELVDGSSPQPYKGIDNVLQRLTNIMDDSTKASTSYFVEMALRDPKGVRITLSYQATSANAQGAMSAEHTFAHLCNKTGRSSEIRIKSRFGSVSGTLSNDNLRQLFVDAVDILTVKARSSAVMGSPAQAILDEMRKSLTVAVDFTDLLARYAKFLGMKEPTPEDKSRLIDEINGNSKRFADFSAHLEVGAARAEANDYYVVISSTDPSKFSLRKIKSNLMRQVGDVTNVYTESNDKKVAHTYYKRGRILTPTEEEKNSSKKKTVATGEVGVKSAIGVTQTPEEKAASVARSAKALDRLAEELSRLLPGNLGKDLYKKIGIQGLTKTYREKVASADKSPSFLNEMSALGVNL